MCICQFVSYYKHTILFWRLLSCNENALENSTKGNTVNLDCE